MTEALRFICCNLNSSTSEGANARQRICCLMTFFVLTWHFFYTCRSSSSINAVSGMCWEPGGGGESMPAWSYPNSHCVIQQGWCNLCKNGSSWRSPWGKKIFILLPCVEPQPLLVYSDCSIERVAPYRAFRPKIGVRMPRRPPLQSPTLPGPEPSSSPLPEPPLPTHSILPVSGVDLPQLTVTIPTPVEALPATGLHIVKICLADVCDSKCAYVPVPLTADKIWR